MEKLTITTLDGKKHQIRKINGRAWRITAEYIEGDFKFTNPALLEEAAAYIAEFFDGVTSEEILELPMEEILPTAFAIRDKVFESITPKVEAIEKNSGEDKAQ